MGAVTRKDLARAVNEEIGFSQRMSLKLVDALFDIITEAVNRGEVVKVVRFGTFRMREKAGRKGVSPKDGRPIHIPGRKTVVFMPGKKLKEAVNGEGQSLLQDRRGE